MFQAQTGTRGLVAPAADGIFRPELLFQAQTGTRGLVACHLHTIAPEAKKRKHVREPLFSRAFQGEK